MSRVVDANSGALGGEVGGDGAPDTARTTGYDRDLMNVGQRGCISQVVVSPAELGSAFLAPKTMKFVRDSWSVTFNPSIMTRFDGIGTASRICDFGPIVMAT